MEPQIADLYAVRRTLGNFAVLAKGLGPSSLYDSSAGQRAGPTARKVSESNEVLTLRGLSAVPVRDESLLMLARFSCAIRPVLGFPGTYR